MKENGSSNEITNKKQGDYFSKKTIFSWNQIFKKTKTKRPIEI